MADRGLQDSTLSIDQLLQQAKEAEPLLRDRGERMLEDLRDRFPGLFDAEQFTLGSTKLKSRALEKISDDYIGDASKISDLARGRFMLSSPEQIRAVQQYLKENSVQLGVEIAKDQFSDPGDLHYRTINLKVRMPNGHLAELRFDHKDMAAATDAVRAEYLQSQAIERLTTAENRDMTIDEFNRHELLVDRIRDVHDQAASEAGLNALVDDRGEARLVEHATQRVARDPSFAGRLSDLLEELGKRAGMIGGLAIGGGMILSGATPADAAIGTAEAVIPGASSAVALSEGRIAESGMRALEEIPLGIGITELGRPIGRSLGLDIDPGLVEDLLAGTGQPDPQEALFRWIYTETPDVAHPGMPPEIESLVEFKRLASIAEQKLKNAVDTPGRDGATIELARFKRLFADQYNDLAATDALDVVVDWLADNPAPQQLAPTLPAREPPLSQPRMIPGALQP